MLLNRRSVSVTLVTVLALTVVLTLAPSTATAKKEKKGEPIESYSAFVISSTAGSRVRTRLSVTRWSTDEERAQLKDVLVAGADPKAFADALGKMDQVGTFQFSDTIGYPVRYAKKFEHADGSWQIIAGTDRPLSGAEVLGTNKQRDYLISIIEINSDIDGNMQAVVSPGSELTWDEENQKIDLKNWSGMVYGLSHVRRIK